MIHIEGFKIKSLDELNEIKDNCAQFIETYTMISVSPGFSVSPRLILVADPEMMMILFSALRSRYSLDIVNADDFKHYNELSEFVSGVYDYVTKEGVIKFLNEYGRSYIKKIFFMVR